MVSHEIRTPLNAVNGATALLLDTKPLTQEQLELLELLDAGANHVVLIVEGALLLLSRACVSTLLTPRPRRHPPARRAEQRAVSGGHRAADADEQRVGASMVRQRLRLCVYAAPAPADSRCRRVHVRRSMISFQHRLRDKLATITFTRVVAPDVPECILGDSTRLLQVLSNLLSNASKFTPEGGAITLSVDIQRDAPAGVEATEPPPEAWLRFRVQDTGIGLAKEKLQTVFLPFTQAEQSTVRVYGGTGLGLTICRRIATAMGGSLMAHSEGLGTGVTMEFVIPLRSGKKRRSSTVVVDMTALSRAHPCDAAAAPPLPSPDSPVSDGASSPPSAGADAAPQPTTDCVRVLIAEDDRLCQTLMRKLLPKMGFIATLVDNGASAVEEACSCGPDTGTFFCSMTRRQRCCVADSALRVSRPPQRARTTSF
jgi:signal transduction histidine kinase